MIHPQAIASSNQVKSVNDQETPNYKELLASMPFFYKDPANRSYILQCADALFKTYRLLARIQGLEVMVLTALLPSNEQDLGKYKDVWKRMQETFFRRNRIYAVGMIERDNEGEHAGAIHAHVLLFVAPEARNITRLVYEEEFRRCWENAHGSFVKKALKGNRMPWIKPYDTTGENYARYFCKILNRGVAPARWGKDKGQSYFLTALVPEGLWTRDELPSRWRKSKDPIAWIYCEQARRTPMHDRLELPSNQKRTEWLSDGSVLLRPARNLVDDHDARVVTI